MPMRLQLSCQGGADAGQQADGFRRQQGGGFFGIDDGEAARFAAAGGDLGQQPVRREADRDGDADLPLHGGGEAGQHDGRGRAMQRLGARQVQHRLVDRQRLHQGGQFVHQRADLAGGSGVFREIRFDDDRVGAGFQRLEHRHRALHAVDPSDIAGGGDDAAGAAADDHRAGLKLRPVALLDAGIERVAVDMGDGQVEQER